LIPNIVFIGLRYAFVGLMYVFLVLVVRAIYRDIKAPQAPKQRRKKREQPQLVVITADRNVGARYMLTEDITIGRAANANVIIDDTYASQQHARVYEHNETYCVEDLGSTNGTGARSPTRWSCGSEIG
jgi:pSer/pThr/pTyr-binding forkhead associated (FHA) protein